MRRAPRSTRAVTLFPTRRSSDLYLAWCAVVLISVVAIVWPAVVLARGHGRAWRRARRGARALFALTGISLELIGRFVPAAGRQVIICNHQSYLDGLILVAMLEHPVRFVAKRELITFAPLRWFLTALGVLFVERFDRRQGVVDAGVVADAVRAGDTVMFFPEGTFHRMAGLLPFQLGAFETALSAGATITPLVIRGTRQVLRGDDIQIHRGTVIVEVLESMAVSACEPQRRWAAAVRLRREARARILARCKEPDLAGHSVRTRLNEGDG